ncbi:hypothetical protein [uncultured Gimesia sp.]|uniref:hypothetical protein n=1 Tax=uncultured Gimesia sp. TaxID=1678688 RepID=UPI00260E2421|nr:hypothetical protein [uncultured Gimesia sp.]
MTGSQLPRFMIQALFFVAVCFIRQTHGEVSRGDNHFVIDGVKIPVGSETEVIGPIRSSGHKLHMSSGYAALQGIWINGRANQDKIYFHLCRAEPGGWPTYKDFKALQRGVFYKIRGQIIEGRVYCEHKAITLVVKHIEAVPPREIEFSDLIDRETTFEGVATPGGIIKTKEGEAQIDNMTEWPESVAGKQIFVRGTVRKSQEGFRIDAINWHPTDLYELVGQNVSLEGTLSNDSSPGFFEYRKKYLYLTSPDGSHTKYDKYFSDRLVCVSGKLVLEDRPELKWNGPKEENPITPWFVIREAKVTFLEKDYGEYEGGGPIYATLHRVSEGVPELLAECAHRGNGQFNPAAAVFYVRRNEDVINQILTETTTETRDVLARRMNEEKVSRIVRLIYAAMLAHLNDKRGRTFLIESLKDHDTDNLPNALYCLGEFPSLGSKQTQSKTEIRWAEEPMIALMQNRERFDVTNFYGFGGSKEFSTTIADATVVYSDVTELMLKVNSPAAQRAIIDYLVSNRTSFSIGTTGGLSKLALYERLQRTDPPIPAEDLKKMQQFQAELDALRNRNQ